MSQATKLAVGAKNEAIDSAEHEATGARQDAEKARAELARVAQRITEEKNRQKMAANDAEAEMKRRAAQLTSAANTEHGLIAKNRMLHSVLRDTEIELKSTEEDNDKLRGFMLVYKSMAENLNSDAHAAEWQLATLEKKQRGNGKVMKVARKLGDAARDENYQMKSMYESLERSRRKAVEQAAEKERLAEDKRVQRMADKKKEAKLAMAAKEAEEQVELQRLKKAAEQAAVAAQEFVKK